MCLQGIMVVIFIILDWIIVLTKTTTMIPCRRASWRELAIAALTQSCSGSLANGKRFENALSTFYLVQNLFIKNQPFLFSTGTPKVIELPILSMFSGKPSRWPEYYRKTLQLASVFDSDHYRFWDANASLPAVFLTDTGNRRGYMIQCYHKDCDDMSQVTPEMLTYLERTSANMAELAISLTNETCQMKKTGRVDIVFYSCGLVE